MEEGQCQVDPFQCQSGGSVVAGTLGVHQSLSAKLEAMAIVARSRPDAGLGQQNLGMLGHPCCASRPSGDQRVRPMEPADRAVWLAPPFAHRADLADQPRLSDRVRAVATRRAVARFGLIESAQHVAQIAEPFGGAGAIQRRELTTVPAGCCGAFEHGGGLGGGILSFGDFSSLQRVLPGLFVSACGEVVQREERGNRSRVGSALLDDVGGEAVELLALLERQPLVGGVAVQGVVEPPSRPGAGAIAPDSIAASRASPTSASWSTALNSAPTISSWNWLPSTDATRISRRAEGSSRSKRLAMICSIVSGSSPVGAVGVRECTGELDSEQRVALGPARRRGRGRDRRAREC